MRVFFRHYAAEAPVTAPEPTPAPDRHTREMGEIVAALCDEEAISAAGPGA
jgi:hypothetical protein